MQGKLLVFVAILALAAATEIQTFNGTLYGQWSHNCRSTSSVTRNSTILSVVQGTKDDKNITLFGSGYLNNTQANCTVEAVNATKVYIAGFEDYSSVSSIIGTKAGQFVVLNCTIPVGEPEVFSDSSSSSDSNGNGTITASNTTNTTTAPLIITVVNLAQGILLNYKEEPDCSAYFTAEQAFNLSEVSLLDGKPQGCNCSTICFDGNTTISDVGSDGSLSSTGYLTLYSSNITGSYVSVTDGNTTNTTVQDVSLDCLVSYVPEYPSPVILIEDCTAENQTTPIVDSAVSLTFLDDGSVVVGDQADATCLSVVLGQSIMIASLFMTLLVAFANLF